MMMKHAAAACVAALLGSSVARAQSSPGDNTKAVTTDSVTGKKTARRATDAERAHVWAALEQVGPSLAQLKQMEADLAGLEGLEAELARLNALDARHGGLKGLEAEMARLQRMVETETPVSTKTTSEGTVRVYRDGTTVIDSGGSRNFRRRKDHP